MPKIRLTITNDEITDLNQLAISINGDARRRPAIERRSLVLAGDWLADGRHRLTLTCVGYKDFETEILVNEQTPQPERNIAFEPLPALLTLVWSGPSDCELFIDGTKYGRGTHRSGVKIPLDHRKSHVLSAKAEGFVFTRSQAVSLKTPGEEKTQELFFEKIPPPVPPRPPIPETFTIRFVAGSQRAPEKVRLTIESLDGRKLYDRYHYTIDQPLDFPWGKGTYRLHISANGYKLIRSDRFEISDNGMPIRLPFVQDTGAPW